MFIIIVFFVSYSTGFTNNFGKCASQFSKVVIKKYLKQLSINMVSDVLEVTANQPLEIPHTIIFIEPTQDFKSMVNDVTRIAIPSLAACISEPVLTLVDTFYIGQFLPPSIATMALAGMSVNGALFNIIAAMTIPLCAATTSLVSKENGLNDKMEIQKALYNGIFLASMIGFIFTTILTIFGNFILQSIFGLTGSTHLLSKSYLYIRGLSLPFVLLNYVVVGFSLGVQDMTSPLLSIGLSALVNIIGDYLFIQRFKWGLSGAAAATTLATAIGTTISLIRLIRIHGNIPNTKFQINKNYLKSFFISSKYIFIGSILNTCTYSSMSRISSFTSNPIQHIASHQIVMQIWWFLSYFSSPISMAAQAIIPRDIISNNHTRASKMTSLLLKLGIIIGLVMSSLNLLFQLFGNKFFTHDIIVSLLLQKVTFSVVISQFIICITTVLDGIFIGNGRMNEYLIASMLSTSMAWLVNIITFKQQTGLIGAWYGLLCFSSIRLFYYITCIIKTNRKQ